MIFEQNKKALLKNNEINLSKLQEIQTNELSDFCHAIEEYDKIITEKDENKQSAMIHDFLITSFEKNNDETLHPEMLKLWRKLYHALCYRLEAMEKIEESTEVISQIIEDWASIMDAKALKERLA